jgi:hypothetical protein
MARKFGEDQENTGGKEEKSISCGEVQKQIYGIPPTGLPFLAMKTIRN